MYVKVDYSVKAKKNPHPNMAGQYAIYTKNHWWSKWKERQTYADLKLAKIDAEKLVELPIFFHSLEVWLL